MHRKRPDFGMQQGEKNLEKLKVFVDKEKPVWYYNKADTEKGVGEMTYKRIEENKKKDLNCKCRKVSKFE